MLNAVDRYKDVSGSFRIVFENNGQNETVDFEASPATRASFVRIADQDGKVVEHASEDDEAITLHPAKAAYQKFTLASAEKPEGPRYYKDQDCNPVWVQRQDPAGAIGADEVILPQNYAFWLTGSDSKFIGYDQALGRRAAVIEGRHDAYLRKKLGANRFKMWVDDETGVLLKLEGRKGNGKRVYYIDVQNIRFNSDLELMPSISAPSGWKNMAVDAAL